MKNHPRIPRFLHPNLQFREIAGRNEGGDSESDRHPRPLSVGWPDRRSWSDTAERLVADHIGREAIEGNCGWNRNVLGFRHVCFVELRDKRDFKSLRGCSPGDFSWMWRTDCWGRVVVPDSRGPMHFQTVPSPPVPWRAAPSRVTRKQNLLIWPDIILVLSAYGPHDGAICPRPRPLELVTV